MAYEYPSGITYDGKYFYIVGWMENDIWIFNSDFDQVITCYDTGDPDDPNRGYFSATCWNGTHIMVKDARYPWVFSYNDGWLFDNVYVENFKYKKLGVPYYENFTLIYDSSQCLINNTIARSRIGNIINRRIELQ